MKRAFLIGLGAWIAVGHLAAAQEVYEPVRWQQTPEQVSFPQDSEPVYSLPQLEPTPAPPTETSLPGWPAYMPPLSAAAQAAAVPAPSSDGLAPPPIEALPPIESLPPVPSAEGPPPPDGEGPPAEELLAPPPGAPVAVVAPGPPPKLWEGSFEMGLNGSEGNSQTFNVHFGAHGKRKTKYNVLSADLDYNKNQSDSVETANRALLDWRWERLFEPSPWTWFVHGTVDYDEFKAFDVRVAIDSGLGYKFIRTEKTTLLGRLGAGTSREIGGPDNEFDPELVFGSEFEHQLTQRQKVTYKIEYIPNVADFDDFRIRSELGWQVVLDEEMNLSLKASLIDRYDSEPEGAKCNDLDYALTVLWSF